MARRARYSREFRESAVALVFEQVEQHASFLSAEHSVFAAAFVVAAVFVFVSLTSPA